MHETQNKTLEEFLTAYSEGKRHFLNWNFDEDSSLKGLDLSEVFFENCFLFLDFREVKLTNEFSNTNTANYK